MAALGATLHIAVLSRETGRAAEDAGLGAIRFADEDNYYRHCADGVAEQGWSFLLKERSLRSPPLPCLWLLMWGRNVAVTRLANIALMLAGSLCIACVVRDRLGARLGLLAFALCAGGYQVVLFSGTILTEPLAVFFICLFFWSLHRADRSGSLLWVALSGIACGLAALSRPSLQLFPVVFLGAWGLVLLRDRGRRPQAPPNALNGKRMAVMLVCFTLTVLPWFTKNFLALGVARLANGFGAVMYLGSDLRTDGDEPVFSSMQWQTSALTRPHDHMQIRGDAILMQAALENIRRHPVAWAQLALRKVGRTLIGGANWHFFPANHYFAKQHLVGVRETAVDFVWWTLAGTLVTVFGLVGMVLALPRQRVIAVAGLALIGYLLALHAISYAIPRFGLPFYPALVIGFCAYLSEKRRRALTLAMVVVCAALPAYLAFRYDLVPRCVVSAAKIDHFRTDKIWTVANGQELPILIEADGIVPPFNACLFVEATVERGGGPTQLFGALYLRKQGAGDFDEASMIQWPLPADGRRHVYQLSLELLPAWRGRHWDALKLLTLPQGGTNLRDVKITLAH